jgi:hypothetical protein
VGAGEVLGEELGTTLGPALGLSDGIGEAVGGGVARSARNATAQAGSALTGTPLCSAVTLSFA